MDVKEEATRRLKLCIEGWSDNIELARDDIRFRHGDQWDENVRKERKDEGRPILTINHMEGFIDQVVGDQLINAQTIKVSPVESKSTEEKAKNTAGTKDYKMAQVFQGIIKNIEYVSRAEIAYNNASDHAAGHGFGYLRLVTQYNDDDTFDQDILIKQVANSMTVYLDPVSIEPDGSDANYVFISQWADKDEYAIYNDKTPIATWGEMQSGDENWYEGDKVRLVEYYRKVKTKKTIALLADGSVVSLGTDKKQIEANRADLELQDKEIKKEREVDSIKVKYSLLSAGGEIESGIWPGKYLPIIPMYGKRINVDGKTIYRGVIRHAKDSQKVYNYFETAATEQVALTPKAPYVATATQLEGYEDQWESANRKNYPYLLYNGDPKAQGAPQRQMPPQMSSGHAERSQSSRTNMQYATGIHDAGLGARSNEVSGKAINARKREGDVATYAYSNNKAITISHVGRCLIDIIPKIYTRNRVIRVRNFDDTEDFVEINIPSQDGKPKKNGKELMHDLSVGKYDVVVSTGPSFTTQREESTTAMYEMMNANPTLFPVIGDLVMDGMDWINADKIAERLRKQLPPGLLDKDEDEDDEEGPSEQEQMMQQQQQELAQMEKMKQEAEIAKYEADLAMADAKNVEAEAKILIATNKLVEAGIDPNELIPQEEPQGMGPEEMQQEIPQGIVPPEMMPPEEFENPVGDIQQQPPL